MARRKDTTVTPDTDAPVSDAPETPAVDKPTRVPVKPLSLAGVSVATVDELPVKGRAGRPTRDLTEAEVAMDALLVAAYADGQARALSVPASEYEERDITAAVRKSGTRIGRGVKFGRTTNDGNTLTVTFAVNDRRERKTKAAE